jgi:hypothetical protein
MSNLALRILCEDGAAFPQPGRAKDNSPAIYRWVSGRKGRVPSGTKEQARLATRFLSPLRGLRAFGNRLPTVETVGYFRSSRRD